MDALQVLKLDCVHLSKVILLTFFHTDCSLKGEEGDGAILNRLPPHLQYFSLNCTSLLG